MKKSRFFLVFLFISLLFVLLPATAKAAMWDVPVGPGESFRWVFVTSMGTMAIFPNICEYNNFINHIVMGPLAGTLITGVTGKDYLGDVAWKAIASTYGTDAIDNIGESPAGIYTPDGRPVAYGTTDMFDGVGLLNPIMISELGTEPICPLIWTGTDPYGRAAIGAALGYPPTIGTRNGEMMQWLSGSWISFMYSGPTDVLPLYAISEVMTVVPAPGAIILATTGLLSSTLGLKRLRRKHQE